jgi:hypothetical protein
MERHATAGHMGATRQKSRVRLTRKVRDALNARDKRDIRESAHLLDSRSLD